MWCILVAMLFCGTAVAQPNVLFITIDDLNDWVGCLGGHPQAKTPNIDALARRGMLFTNAHCQAPICNPSRVSFLTGLRPSSTGIYLNNHHFRRSPKTREAVTLPQYFKANGYVSIGVGKLFHASYVDKPSFSVYGPSPGQGPLPDEKISVPAEVTSSRLWDWGPWPESNDKTHDFQDAQWAAQKLSGGFDRPFFLGVGFYRPHVPTFAPPEWFAAHPIGDVKLPEVKEDDLDDVPAASRTLHHNPLPPPHAWFVKSGKWRQAVQSYLAASTFVDHCVGMVIEALDRSAHGDDTWIVLLSDHGFFLGEKQRWAKQSVWERATKTPLIIVPPKNATQEWRRGARCAKPVELLSLYPTLVELCGLPKREGLEGVSLRPLLEDPGADWPHVAITTYRQNNHAIRSEHWRYIRYADGSEELYDHRTDPNEWNNLAADPSRAEIIATHRAWLPTVNVAAPSAAEGTTDSSRRKCP